MFIMLTDSKNNLQVFRKADVRRVFKISGETIIKMVKPYQSIKVKLPVESVFELLDTK